VITGLTNGTTYPVRIRAVNSLGAGSQSNAVNGTPNLFVPGVLLHLDCEQGVVMTGSNVSTWTDRSGNSIVFSAKPNSQLPLRHGDNSIKFTTSQMYYDPNARVLQSTSSLLQQANLYTLFCVVRAGANNSAVISKSTDAAKRRRYQISVTQGIIYGLEGNGDIGLEYNTGTGTNVNIKRLIVLQTSASNQLILRYNGSEVATLTNDQISGATTNTAPVFLGASPFQPSTSYNAEASTEMYTYEILLYSSVLSLAQIQLNEQYLNARWGVY
jgi:hypothetical protein